MAKRPAKADWGWLRAKLLERSGGGFCERCGNVVRADSFEAHHRKLRSGQGKDVLSNLVALCTKCHHDKVHGRPTLAKQEGFIVTRYADPAPIPLKHALHGWVLLFDDGSVQPAMFAEPAEEVG